MNALEQKGKVHSGAEVRSCRAPAWPELQMAEVAVDRETGVVKMKKFVAVQDMGLVINRKTRKSQIYGAMIMGIAAHCSKSGSWTPRPARS